MTIELSDNKTDRPLVWIYRHVNDRYVGYVLNVNGEYVELYDYWGNAVAAGKSRYGVKSFCIRKGKGWEGKYEEPKTVGTAELLRESHLADKNKLTA